MDLEIRTIIHCSITWENKTYSVILIDSDKKSDFRKVKVYLNNQDKGYFDEKLLKQLPLINSINDLNKLCEYCGKFSIYNIPLFISKMEDEGIKVFIYQNHNHSYS